MNASIEQQKQWYRNNFELFEKSLNGESREFVHPMRREAMLTFAELGFPSTRDEEWKFTNIAPIARTPFQPVISPNDAVVSEADLKRFTFADLDCHRLVFVDGHFAPALSRVKALEKGVVLENLSTALRNRPGIVQDHLARHTPSDLNAFTALSLAFLRDGAFAYVPDRTVVSLPVHIMYVSTKRDEPAAIHPRNLVVVGADAQLTLIETYASLDLSHHLTNAVTEIVLGDGAIVEHDKVQIESDKGYHVSDIHVRQGAKSSYVSNSIALGGSIVRNSITAYLGGEYAVATLNGLSLGTGTQLIDNHTSIDHATPNCESHELYKAVLDGKSKGVFNGKIFVRKDAQKTDAKQTNQTLLLSDDATIDTKPQLEIFADDVRCTHGATVGQLDSEQVFYLRSRGIGEELARDILTFAFASDVAQRIRTQQLEAKLEHLLHDKLNSGRSLNHSSE